MINLRTAILFAMYGLNLGKILFNVSLFFASYLNSVCFLLKKITQLFTNDCTNIISKDSRNKNDLIQDTFPFSLGHTLMVSIIHKLKLQQCLNVSSLKHTDMKTVGDDTVNVHLLKIKEVEHFNNVSNYNEEMDDELQDEISTDLDDFEEEQYNFDFIDGVYDEDNFE